MASATHYHAGRLHKATPGEAPVSLLTYPAEDADGDLVRPDGGVWVARPLVNFEHTVPVGTGVVAVRALKGLPGPALIGTTRFARTAADLYGLPLGGHSPGQCLDAAGDTERSVALGLLSGVSMEFVPRQWKSRGFRSPRHPGRDAWDVRAWDGEGWAHCARPVNHHARVLLKSLAAGPAEVADRLRTLAGSGRFPGGAVVCDVVLKALRREAARLPAAPTTVRVPELPVSATKPAQKAFPEDEDEPADGLGDPAEMDEFGTGDDDTPDEADPGAATKPTPAAFAQVAQLGSDLLAAIDAAMQTAEHEAGVARLTEFRDMLEEELGSLADDGRGLFPNGGLDAAPDAPADAPVDKAFKVPRARDGALLFKAFPKGPPIRFRLADLRPAEPKQMTKADDAKAVRVSRELDRAAKRRAALGY